MLAEVSQVSKKSNYFLETGTLSFLVNAYCPQGPQWSSLDKSTF